jgi:sugar/nucleoside kinase (ribokinase family)
VSATNDEVAAPVRTLCLGEPLVELICERAIDDLALADAFVPRFGGAVANVAVVAARHGARVALAGGAGDDAWGRWLLARLRGERVDTSLFELIGGSQTPLAAVAVDAAGKPTYEVYGEVIATVSDALSDRVEPAVRASAALLISSNTLVGADERAVTMRAAELARELGRPVIFDPNVRLRRWRSRTDAAASVNACVPGALLVCVNAAEAQLMTGEDDPERAALALVKAGARLVVSTIGAGDWLTGILLARLALSDFYPPAVAAALPEAVTASARACERWGAID